MGAEGLAAPVVDPREYDEAYYPTCCAGYEAWAPSGGAKFAGVLRQCHDHLISVGAPRQICR
ncbi:MAG: hypothetical protein ACYCO3_13195 [Mycobacteriales bacterium]